MNSTAAFRDVERLKDQVMNRLGYLGARVARRREIWLAVWEAAENALKHSSEPGDVVQLSVLADSETGQIVARMRQSKPWLEWDRLLGSSRRRMIRETTRFALGGTATMLWLADGIEVTDQGREITMHFSGDAAGTRPIEIDLASDTEGNFDWPVDD
ncbi:MAG: hypothetical protein O7G83_15420 [Proteobacteria bacterium]|nr:hypothetical protein [Pseudomonadota bacterium]